MYLKCIYVCIQISLIVGVDDHVSLLISTIYFNLIVHSCIIDFEDSEEKEGQKKELFILHFIPSTEHTWLSRELGHFMEKQGHSSGNNH